MAHFYGGVKGTRSEATRLGSEKSGLSCFANGWNLGVDVNMYYDDDKEEDVAYITLTSGSGGNSGRNKVIGSFTIKDLTPKGA